MPRERNHVGRRERLTRVVDLQVAEPEVVERLELLGTAATLHVRVTHVGVLHAVRRGHLTRDRTIAEPRGVLRRVEQVADANRDRAATHTVMKGDRGDRGVHLAEIGDHCAVRQRAQ